MEDFVKELQALCDKHQIYIDSIKRRTFLISHTDIEPFRRIYTVRDNGNLDIETDNTKRLKAPIVKEVGIVNKDFPPCHYESFNRTNEYAKCEKCNSMLVRLYDPKLSISAEKAVPYWGTMIFEDDYFYVDYSYHFPCCGNDDE